MNYTKLDGKNKLNSYKGNLRKDKKLFDSVWAKYEKWYIKYTNNKVKEFARPMRINE
jgi:hypothetical protein